MTLKNFLFQGDYGTVATPSKEAFARWLNENDGQNDNETSQPKVGADLLFVGCIVCTVGSCYIYCMWHMFRRWWCPGRADITADITVLDHDGVKFNLDPTQRRAALEAIFSEASKIVTDSMFFKKKAGAKEAIEDYEKGVPVTASTRIEDGKNDVETIDLEANGSCTYSIGATGEFENPTIPDAAEEDLLACPLDRVSKSVVKGDSSNGVVDPPEVCLSLPHHKPEGYPVDIGADLALPTLIEEYNGAEGLPLPKLAFSTKFSQSVNFPTAISEESEQPDEEERLCAICLCDYETGDLIISSRYCSHIYHKDCILEWLEKSSDCPCCRVVMMTDGEMTEAAVSILGKPRMARVMESIRSFQTARSSAPGSPGAAQVNIPQHSPRSLQSGRMGLASPSILQWNGFQNARSSPPAYPGAEHEESPL